ncbi:MAG: BrnT family toxin [Terracidiphilus sp.]
MHYTGFDWDEGNARKNEKHGVSKSEVEQVFLNKPLLLADDQKHSQRERQFHALGRSDQDRWLHVTFTERQAGTLVRPISARAMSRKERAIYEQAVEANS